MPETEDRPAPSLRNVLITGALWVMAGRWSMRLIGLVSTAILARLLVPADFGLVAVAMVVIGFVEIFFAIGVDTALIQNPRAGRDHFDTAWTLRIIQSWIISAVLLAVAPFAAEYFKDPRVADVLPFLCIPIIVGSLGNIGVIALRKELRFEKEFQLMLVGRLMNFAVTVAAALVLRSYWALIIGQCMGSVLSCIQSYVAHPYRPRPSLKTAREIFGFSQWMLLVSISYYGLNRIDEIVVGREGGGTAMGIYTVSSGIAELPTTELAFPLSRALLPGYAKLKGAPRRLKHAFLNVLGFLATASVGASLGIALVADHLVPVVLGSQWLDTIPLIKLLAIFAAIRTLYGSAGNLLIVLGRVRLLAGLQWLQFLATAAAVVSGMEALGLIGVAIAKLAVAPVFFCLLFLAVTRTSAIARREIGEQIWRPLVAGLVMALALRAFAAVAPASDVAALALGVALGAAVYAGALYLLWRACGRPAGAESFFLDSLKQRFARK